MAEGRPAWFVIAAWLRNLTWAVWRLEKITPQAAHRDCEFPTGSATSAQIVGAQVDHDR